MDYYVTRDGKETNSGWNPEESTTMGKAFKMCSANDTIYFTEGTYVLSWWDILKSNLVLFFSILKGKIYG